MKNSIIHVGVVILNSAISFGINVILAKYFTVVEYGFLSSTLAISSMLGAIVALEIDKNAGKMAAVESEKNVYAIVSSLRLAALILAVMFILTYKLVAGNDSFERTFYWLLLFSGAISGLNIAYFLELTGTYHIYVIAIFIEKIVLLALISVLFLQSLLTPLTYAAAFLFVTTTSVALQNIYVSKSCVIKFSEVLFLSAGFFAYLKKNIFENILLVFLVFIQSGFTGWSRALYGEVYGFESVAFFSVALQFVVIYSIFLGNFERIWRPIIYKDLLRNSFHSAFKYTLFSALYVLLASTFLYLLFDNIIIFFFDQKYFDVIYYFPFLVLQSLAILINSLATIFTLNFKKPFILLISNCAAISFIALILFQFEFEHLYVFVLMIPITQIILSIFAIIYSVKINPVLNS